MLSSFLIVLYRNIYYPEYLTSSTETCTTKLLNSANQQDMSTKREDSLWKHTFASLLHMEIIVQFYVFYLYDLIELTLETF